MAVKFVSLTLPSSSSGGGLFGSSPDVDPFEAGTLQTDDTITLTMHWDALYQYLTIDYRATAPSVVTNFSGILLTVKVPDGNGGFQWLAGQPIDFKSFTPSNGKYKYGGTIQVGAAQVPSSPETWSVICASVNANGVVNVDSDGKPTGPSVDLLTLIPQQITFAPPTQPAAGDWTLLPVLYGNDPQTGKNKATIRAQVNINPGDVKYFSAYQYIGSSAPTDPGQYIDVCDQTKASTGSTILSWTVDCDPSQTITLQIIITATSATYTQVADLRTAKSVVVNAATLPAQVTNFSVLPIDAAHGTLEVQGGVPMGALVFDWTPPTDPVYFTTYVYALKCDFNYNALPGEDWYFIGDATGEPGDKFDQRLLREWWPLAGEGYFKFKAQSISRVLDGHGNNLENTSNPPTVTLHVPATTGMDATAFNLQTLDNSLQILAGKLTALTKIQGQLVTTLANDLQIVSGSLSIKSIDLGKALGSSYNNAEFKIDPATNSLTVNGLDLSKAIAATLSTELGVSSGKFGVVSIVASKVTTGTLGAGVIYAGTITASQIISGSIAANIAYLGTLNASQINAGTFTGFTINSSTLNSVVINTGTINATVSFLGTVNADKINSGNMNAVNMVGGTLALNRNGITTSINNNFITSLATYAGMIVSDNASGYFTMQDPTSFAVMSASGSALARLSAPGGFSARLNLTASDNATSVIANAVTGQARIQLIENGIEQVRIQQGITCTQWGIAAAGFNPYYNNLQYTGDSRDVQCQIFLNGNWQTCFFVDRSGGSAYRFLRMRGGAYTGIWDGFGGSFSI